MTLRVLSWGREKNSKLWVSQQNRESLQVCKCPQKKPMACLPSRSGKNTPIKAGAKCTLMFYAKDRVFINSSIRRRKVWCYIHNLESGSTNELKLIVKGYWTSLRRICLISDAYIMNTMFNFKKKPYRHGFTQHVKSSHCYLNIHEFCFI